MNHHRMFRRLALLGLFLALYGSMPAAQLPFNLVAQENLKAVPQESGEAQADTLNALINDEETFDQTLNKKLAKQLAPDAFSKRRAVFALLGDYQESQAEATEDQASAEAEIMDLQTIQDLELFCGGNATPHLYVGNALCRTHTEIGRAVLYAHLAQPTSNIDELTHRQNIIRTLATNDQLYQFVHQQLSTLAQAENVMLSFWDEDIFSALCQQTVIQIPGCKKWLEPVNKNEYLLQANHTLGRVGDFCGMAVNTAAVIILPALVISSLVGNQTWADSVAGLRDTLGGYGVNFDAISYFSMGGLACIAMRNLGAHSGANLLKATLAGKGVAEIIPDEKTRQAIFGGYQKKMALVAHYLKALQQVGDSLQANPLIATRFPVLEKVHALGAATGDLRHLLELLQTSTFDQATGSTWFVGRAIAAYRLMVNVKHQLVDAMQALGTIDAYASMATLLREHAQKPVGFCFAEFIEPTLVSTPVLELQGAWHPMVPAEYAVPNNLMLGDNTAPNAVITGANAGGKSTFTKATLLCVLLGQTFGVVPAHDMRFTPVKRITTYLKINDNIGTGDSLLIAGAKRTQTIFEQLDAIPAGQFSISAIDEVFNGTNYGAGQASAYAFLQKLSERPGNLCITPTHFPAVTKLAAAFPTRFTNYQMPIEETQYGIIKPFKLLPGVHTKVATFAMMQDAGIDADFLALARQKYDEFAADNI